MQSVAEMESHDVLLNKLPFAWCAPSYSSHELQKKIKGGGKVVEYVLRNFLNQ